MSDRDPSLAELAEALVQRMISLESTVRLAHRHAVAIVDDLGATYREAGGPEDRALDHALAIARTTDEILTGEPRQEADDE